MDEYSISLVRFLVSQYQDSQSLTSVLPTATDSEIVWLNDVTSSFEIDKRTLSDHALPDELTFRIRRGSDDLTLNLKRNHGIDPNADIYVVKSLKDGPSKLEKSQHLKTEDVAYYQDRNHGAFMTVRCIKRISGQCERFINGYIQLGDRYYDLQPANVDRSRNLFEASDLLGKRYVLQEQGTIQRDAAVKYNDQLETNYLAEAANIENELIDLLQRNIADLPNRETTDKRQPQLSIYWVKLAVLADPSVWHLFSELLETNDVEPDDEIVASKIREFYSHIINGVSLLYNNIEDPEIDINIILRAIYIYKAIESFPQRNSFVKFRHGVFYTDVSGLLMDLEYWDRNIGSTLGVEYDHAMLFTRYDLYDTYTANNGIRGRSPQSKVCIQGVRISVIESRDIFVTVSTAAHELGHNLGAVHDGDKKARSCPAADSFIMSSHSPQFDPEKPYSRNPWLFSNCSVAAFKKILKKKDCVRTYGPPFNPEEWNDYMIKLTGQTYSLDEQCQFIYGPRSRFCQDEPADICLYMQCTHPVTGECIDEYYNAARGSKCNENMYCIEGRCAGKSQN
ncbi:hypothetical protein ACJMK2_011430, partial [Sinanodonta woodiana]